MKALNIVFFSLAALLISACSSNSEDTKTVSHVVVAQSVNQVRDVIIECGKARGWTMQVVSEGVITGHIDVKGQQANINITYDRDIVNINYISGSRSATDGQPPKNYARWARLLGRDIQTKLK